MSLTEKEIRRIAQEEIGHFKDRIYSTIKKMREIIEQAQEPKPKEENEFKKLAESAKSMAYPEGAISLAIAKALKYFSREEILNGLKEGSRGHFMFDISEGIFLCGNKFYECRPDGTAVPIRYEKAPSKELPETEAHKQLMSLLKQIEDNAPAVAKLIKMLKGQCEG